MTESLLEKYPYQIPEWIKGGMLSVPKEEIETVDYSEGYDRCIAHLFKLENGKYAIVSEKGCSCYDDSWANITTYENKTDAKVAFVEWKSQNKPQ